MMQRMPFICFLRVRFLQGSLVRDIFLVVQVKSSFEVILLIVLFTPEPNFKAPFPLKQEIQLGCHNILVICETCRPVAHLMQVIARIVVYHLHYQLGHPHSCLASYCY